MSSTLSDYLWKRQCNKFNTSRSTHFNKFSRQVYGDPFFLNRMVLDTSLRPISEAPVTSLCWSEQGDNLLSGSRDGKLYIWQPFDSSRPLSTSIATGGRASIFSVNYISNRYAISGSEDGTVYLFDLTNGQIFDRITCSTSNTMLAINANNTNDIITCSEDGIIRQYDFRQRHSCRTDNAPTCASVLLDYSNSSQQPVVRNDPVRVQDVSISDSHHYLAVAGSQNYVYLHDRRMISRQSKDDPYHHQQRSLVKLLVNRNEYTPPRNEICYANVCRFSKIHSDMIMVNWSDDGIYVFNIHDSAETESTHMDNGSSIPTIKHRYRYTGHLNPWVNSESIGFYGLDDEYIFSGTDDGMIFVWERTNEKVIQMFNIGHSPVSALQGHPHLPIMATAVSDHTVKLYTPRSEPLVTSPATHPFAETSYATSSQMFEVDSLIERNEQLKHGNLSNLINHLMQNDDNPPPCYLQ
ncbi:WD40-repeat-containing domain protein [Halteromyces radiatus]|uniref:WD40-repeat-containing domain protein n=1 Tax=Halteromyces radiatus TaxID=101107 RepID=UPI002220E88A|nr:WD40-repeat-containing domain protein [Halteromyces radiatus]KAI8077841.1 WD40-repeat-containing domain protein [Halteromyces radiatus]